MKFASEQYWSQLCQRIGYTFSNLELLDQAFSHESLVHEGLAQESNERLEFLGDSVLGLVVADYLFRHYPQKAEGELAQMKSYIVSRKHLAWCANRLGLSEYLKMGRGEESSGGKRRDSLLSDSLEALLGAVFLEGGFSGARKVILSFLSSDMDQGMGSRKDAKSRLQEWLQTVFCAVPQYRVARVEGPPHERKFIVDVYIANEALAQGSGPSKREASQAAARQALKVLRGRGGTWYKPYLGKLKRSHVFKLPDGG